MTDEQEKIITIIHQLAMRKMKLLQWEKNKLEYETYDIAKYPISVNENGSIFYDYHPISLGDVKAMLKDMGNFK